MYVRKCIKVVQWNFSNFEYFNFYGAKSSPHNFFIILPIFFFLLWVIKRVLEKKGHRLSF